MSLSADLTACAAIVERGDPLRFRCAMTAPVAQRGALFALYAFNVEVSRAPWVTQEPMIAEMRLQWWRDALEEIAGEGSVRRHEVATPLGAVLSAKQAQRLDTLVAARRWDIYRDPFEDRDDFDRYIAQTSGALMQTAAELLTEDQCDTADAGYAAGVGAWLRAVPGLQAQGRVPMLDGTHAGVRDLAQRGLDALAHARRARLPRAATPALLPATAAEPALRAAVSDPAAVIDDRLPQPGLRFTLRAAFSWW
ncbi:squalene/phytoene synthase family protein [Sulfitobacter albidus]|uniref:Squalene/phytoene synthase family protein n=1 Tax=Sulfitobacter albidus TaxID=2829501 RepID=A0A975JGD7_9RHOB|nr:squalene/phytoene synthase family protein [Sulfitobacter albidus]QUJ77817.1 squalene/phytoene synthase family protein [Sulfitobacter albidus]